jgi:hypothetical protein
MVGPGLLTSTSSVALASALAGGAAIAHNTATAAQIELRVAFEFMFGLPALQRFHWGDARSCRHYLLSFCTKVNRVSRFYVAP